MFRKFVLTFVMCLLWVDLTTPEGSHLSECRSVPGKLCETEQVDRDQRTRQRNDKLHSQNVDLGGMLKSSSVTVTSSPKVGQPASSFENNLYQQQELEKERNDSPGNYERLQNDRHRHTYQKPESVFQLQQDSRRDQHRQQSLRGLAIVDQTQKHKPINKKKRVERFRTPNDNQEKSETHRMNARSSYLFHHRSNNKHPDMMTYANGKKAELLYLNSQEENSYGKLLTESTTIHPFIATRQALDYLTSYDSRPRPRKWPLRLILPDREHRTVSEVMAGSGSVTPGQMQGSWVRRNKNRHPRSTVDILRREVENGATDDVRHGVHGKAKSTLTHENITMSEFENGVAESVTFNDTQRHKMFEVTKENTHDADRSRNNAGSVPTDDKTGNRCDEKRNNCRRRRPQRGNKKSRKRKGPNKKVTTETKFKTAVATNDIPPISSVDSVHVFLTKVAFQTQENEQIVKNTSNYPDKTTESNISQSLKEEGESILKPLTGTSDNVHIPKGGLLDQSGKRCVTSERVGHGTREANVDTAVTNTSQPTRKQRQMRANKNKSKNKKGKRKSKNLNVSVQTANSTDNQMFVSLWPDFNPTTFVIPVNGKAVPTQTGVKALPENYAGEITEVSSDNTRRQVSDKNPSAHVPAHTNPGPLTKPVVTSSDTRPLSQTVRTDKHSSTEVASRSRAAFSGVQEMSQTPPTFVKSKTATITKIIATTSAENIVNAFRNVSSTPSSFTISTSPPWVSPMGVPVVPPWDNTSERSSGGFWKTRLRKSRAEIPHENNHRMETKSRNSKYNNTKDERRVSLGGAFHKSTLNVTKQLPNSRGETEIPDNGPFIGYKTAYDFLSHQKGPKTNIHNEGRREANELNRFMGEGMCEIFNKHYVPTRIGGKCE